MKHVRPSYLAMALTTLAGVLIADPAYACPPCGPMTAPVSAAAPSPSVRPPSINIPNVNPGGGINTNIRENIKTGDGSAKPKTKLTPERWQAKHDDLKEKLRNARDDKGILHIKGKPPRKVPDGELDTMADDLLGDKFRRESPEERAVRVGSDIAKQAVKDVAEAARRQAELDRQAKILKEAAERRAAEKEAQDKEAEAKRQAENAPVDWQEKMRRDRVNQGREAPRPGDTGMPWYNPQFNKGEEPYLQPTK